MADSTFLHDMAQAILTRHHLGTDMPIGAVVRNKKNGARYRIVCLALWAGSVDSDSVLVVYASLDPNDSLSPWARDAREFRQKFEVVNALDDVTGVGCG